MKCPGCGLVDDRVVDSRETPEGDAVRRRRECTSCTFRFTTYERIDDIMPQVVKADGKRQGWDRTRLQSGLRRACEKRNISMEDVEKIVVNIERSVCQGGQREVSSGELGDLAMKALRKLDPIAYLRFASVYLNFSEVEQFVEEVERLREEATKTEARDGAAGE